MAVIKTYYKVTNPISAMEDKHGKIGECVEYKIGWVKLLFADGKTRTYFHGEIEAVDQPVVEFPVVPVLI